MSAKGCQKRVSLGMRENYAPGCGVAIAGSAQTATRRCADPSEERAPLAAVGRDDVDDPVAVDQVQLVEALAQLARLRVAEPHAVADPQRVGGGPEHRGLHLAGTLPAVEPQALGHD